MDNIVDVVIKNYMPSRCDIRRLKHWFHNDLLGTRGTGGHFYYFARAVLYATVADFLNIDYAPDVLSYSISALCFSSRRQPISKRLYSAMVEKLEPEIQALILMGIPVSLIIPPVTARILSRTIST